MSIIIISLFVIACSDHEETSINVEEVLLQLSENYVLLPEMTVSTNSDITTFGQYTTPTSRYLHGVLGDRIEAEQLVVVEKGVFYELRLDSQYVFEDIRPRIYDVDKDNQPEYVTIRTHIDHGAAITIYKVVNGRLTELSSIAEIGRSNRWLNIAAIDDLDNDGTIDIAWIETPHIGGTLKVASIENSAIVIKDEVSQYSNHAIGERNLCLSVLTQEAQFKGLYVPNQTRDSIIGFTFQHAQLSMFDSIEFSVDFSLPLEDQFQFDNSLGKNTNCIY